jgi:hypothetical protein
MLESGIVDESRVSAIASAGVPESTTPESMVPESTPDSTPVSGEIDPSLVPVSNPPSSSTIASSIHASEKTPESTTVISASPSGTLSPVEHPKTVITIARYFFICFLQTSPKL